MQVHIFPGRSNHGEEMVVSRAQPSGDWPQRGSYRTSFLRFSRASFVLSSFHRLAPLPLWRVPGWNADKHAPWLAMKRRRGCCFLLKPPRGPVFCG